MQGLHVRLGTGFGAASAPLFQPDPFLANVVFLSSFDGANGSQANLPDQSGPRHTIVFTGTGKLDNTHAEYGPTSQFGFNSLNGAVVADSDDFDLSNANSDQFTVEYSFYQASSGDSIDPIGSWGNAGNFGWLVRHNATTMTFFWTTDGNTIQQFNVGSAIGAGQLNTWVKWCFEKNSAGLIRLYRNGTMLGSTTPADSSMFNSTAVLTLNLGPAGGSSWMDNTRITKGVARYNSNGGYTPATLPFQPVA